MLNKKLLQDAQQSVVAGLIREGIQVVFDATTPYADLKNRVMHLRPTPETISKTDELHLRADCDHETGHFLCSDPEQLEHVTEPLLKLFTNAVEDGYVEREMTMRWFGCGENLRKSNKLIIDELLETDDGSDDYVHRLALAALQMLVFGDSRSDVVKRLGSCLDEELELIADLIPELPKIASTEDSVRLAKLIDERWDWTQARPPKGRSGDESEEASAGDEQGEEGGASDSADGEGESDGEAKDDTAEPTKESEPPKKADGSKPGKGDAKKRAELAKKLGTASLSSLRKRTITAAPFERSRYFAYTDHDVVCDIEPLKGDDMTRTFLESVSKVVPTLRRRLLMEFRGVGTKRTFDKKRGDIDREGLHKVAIGNPRVFTQDAPHEIPGADITLLVDASGSMTRGGCGSSLSNIYIAAQAACAFSQVLDLIKIPNEVLAFTTSSIHACRGKHTSEGGPYSRVRELKHLIVKPSGTLARSRKAHFAGLAHFPSCAENVDGESVMWAARRLAARNRAGMVPILIVFSDGEPASVPESMSLLSWHLKETIQRIEKAGVHTIGVGIQTSTVSRFYKNHLVISDVTDLVGTSYRILRTVLRKARRAS